MNKDKFGYHNTQEGYFGLSMLGLGSYGAHVMNYSLSNQHHATLYFKESAIYYHRAEQALTVEGIAESPEFAIEALMAHAKVAREMDEYNNQWAS